MLRLILTAAYFTVVQIPNLALFLIEKTALSRGKNHILGDFFGGKEDKMNKILNLLTSKGWFPTNNRRCSQSLPLIFVCEKNAADVRRICFSQINGSFTEQNSKLKEELSALPLVVVTGDDTISNMKLSGNLFSGWGVDLCATGENKLPDVCAVPKIVG